MALHVIYANELEALIEPFVRNAGLAAERPDVFARVPVIIPHQAAESFLKLQTAARLGVAANLDCVFIDGFLTGLLQENRAGIQILDRETAQALLLGVFEEAAPEGPLKPVCDYVNAAGTDAETRARRGFQLAGQLAGIFLEYASSWPEVFAAWRKGESFLDDARFFKRDDAARTARYRATEEWQRALWLAFRERCEGAGRRLAQEAGEAEPRKLVLIDEAWELARALELTALPPRIHLFAATLVGEVYRGILARLAERCEVYVYAQNPCREFWDDVAFGKVFRAARPLGDGARFEENPFKYGETDESPLLRLWGRPGREKVRLLNELSECDFEDRFQEPLRKGASVLRRLQQDVYNRAAPRGEPTSTDDSLRIVAAADVRREVEIVADDIWRRVEASKAAGAPLRWHEIAVLVAGGDALPAYVSQIGAVFDALHGIPHSVLEQPLVQGSRLAEAAGLLLDLPFSGFTRPELLPLLMHVNVAAKVPGADPELFAEWTERLNILFEPDFAAVRANTYVEKDLYNWEQGLKRLALGSLLAGERTGVADPFRLDGQAYLVEETSRGEQPAAGAFVLLVRALIDDAKQLRSAAMPLAAWSRHFVRYVRTYLAPADEADERALDRIAGALHGLRELDADGRTVDAATALSFARSAVEGVSAGGGRGLSGGVVVAALGSVRSVPFRAVYVLGLGEGSFPAAERRNPLDLRSIRRRAGDISARERDKYVFLETLLAARESLTLSYVERSPGSGDPIEPSAVVKELQFVLAEMLDKPGRDHLVVRHPLRRYDERYGADPRLGPRYSTAAWREARARKLHKLVRDRIGQTRPYPAPEELPAVFGAEWPAVAALLGLPVLPAITPTEAGETFTISLAQLRDFLENPLQGAAKYLLGLRDESDVDVAEREDEVLAPENRDRTVLLREAFWKAPGDPAAGGAALAELYAMAELRGTMPTGPFGHVALAEAHAALEPWHHNPPLFDLSLAGWAPVRFGKSGAGEASERIEPALVIPVDLDGGKRVHFEITGATEAVAPDGAAVMSLHSKDKAEHVNFLRGFLSAAVLAAAGKAAPGPVRIFVNPCVALEEAGDGFIRIVEPMTAGEARDWLSQLLRDLLTADHAVYFPYESAIMCLKGQLRAPYKTRDAAALHLRLTKEHGKYTGYGPVLNPERFSVPSLEETARLLQVRWGLYEEKVLSLKEYAERHAEPAPEKPKGRRKK